jgi:hypothetical protein
VIITVNDGLGVEERWGGTIKLAYYFYTLLDHHQHRHVLPTPKFQKKILGCNVASSVQEGELALSGTRRITASSRSPSTLIHRLGLSKTT